MVNCLQSSPNGITCLYLELSRLLLLRGLAAGDLLQFLLQGLQALLQFFLRVGSGRGDIWGGWHILHSEVNPLVWNHLFASCLSHHLLIPLLSLSVIWGVNFWSLLLQPVCPHHLPCSPRTFLSLNLTVVQLSPTLCPSPILSFCYSSDCLLWSKWLSIFW